MNHVSTNREERRDFRNIVAGKIERNDPEHYLSQEIDVYYRYNWAMRIISRAAKERRVRVLELGCGLGWFGSLLSRQLGVNAEYIGVDCDQNAVEEAGRRYASLERVRFLQADVCRLGETALDRDHFDFIVWFENLEHLRPENFLDLADTVRGYLRPGGEVLIEVPNRVGGGGLRATGPLRKSSGRYQRGQHNPHHYFEPTLEEARFLFPRACIEGFDPGDHLWLRKALAAAISRAGAALGLIVPAESIGHGGAFSQAALAYLRVFRRFPTWNRAFLIRERKSA